MLNIYKVSINTGATYGYVSYDEQNKTISVEFSDTNVKAAIEAYLSKPHLIREPQAPSTFEFVEREYLATASKEDFQIVLSRMYNCLQVHVNWSIPTDVDMNAI